MKSVHRVDLQNIIFGNGAPSIWSIFDIYYFQYSRWLPRLFTKACFQRWNNLWKWQWFTVRFQY